jgi:dienelactone hydrolase
LAYLDHLYRADLRAFAFRGDTAADFAGWAEPARGALRDLLGLDQISRDSRGFVPSATLGDAVGLDGYTRQPGTLLSEPGLAIPFWFLKPEGTGPHPLALFPHGHYADRGLDYAAGIADSPEVADRIVREDRDVAVQAVRCGFAAISPATRGFAPACIPDITDRHDGRTCRSQLLHALLAGRTVIGERVWDLQQLIDWATALPDIDNSAVLMMGNSGGGVATLYAAACNERITIAVASCSLCTLVGANGVLHHCDCNAVPGLLRFGEFSDVAGLIAPRPLLTVNGRRDPLFPPQEVERAVADVRRIYAAAGAEDAYQHEWGPEGHRFYSALMWPFVRDAMSR